MCIHKENNSVNYPLRAILQQLPQTCLSEEASHSKHRKEPHVANIKSQKKRILTAEKARQRNKAVRSELKTAIKAVRTAVEAGQLEDAQVAANKASRLLDKAASKGIVHKNQAAQRKSGVQKLVNTLK